MTYFPGSPDAIEANADALAAEGRAFGPAGTAIAGIDTPTWAGPTATAAGQTSHDLRSALEIAQWSYRSCSQALSAFASAVRAAEAEVSAVQKSADEAATLGVVPAALAQWNIHQEVERITTQYDHAAAAAAATIRAATAVAIERLGGLPGVVGGSRGKEGVLDEPASLERPIDLSDSGLDPLKVTQGGAGDCWYLAALISLANKPGGKDYIRDHLRWDEQKQGYWVTLYRDGKPEQYFVDEVYTDGAARRGADWASVYEAALVQYKDSAASVNGGYSDNAFRILTGEKHTTSHGENIDDIRQDLGDGKMVTVSSNPGNEFLGVKFWEAGTVDAQVEDPPGVWRCEKIDIVDGHAYSVVKVDARGFVYLINPWGPGNSSDGGGVIKISSDDFYGAFRHQYSSES